MGEDGGAGGPGRRAVAVVDSGATRSMVPPSAGIDLRDEVDLSSPIVVNTAGNQRLTATKEGMWTVKPGVSVRAIVVKGLAHALLSIPQLDGLGYQVQFGDGLVRLRKGGRSTVLGTLGRRNLYTIEAGAGREGGDPTHVDAAAFVATVGWGEVGGGEWT